MDARRNGRFGRSGDDAERQPDFRARLRSRSGCAAGWICRASSWRNETGRRVVPRAAGLVWTRPRPTARIGPKP